MCQQRFGSLAAVATSAATLVAPPLPTQPPSSGAAIIAAGEGGCSATDTAAVHLQAAARGFLTCRRVKQMMGVLHCGGAVAAPVRPSNVVVVHLRVQRDARHGAPLQRSVRHWPLSAATGQLHEYSPSYKGVGWPRHHLLQPHHPLRTGGRGTMRGCTARDPLAAGNTNFRFHGTASEG
jgi:hypothetical protein